MDKIDKKILLIDDDSIYGSMVAQYFLKRGLSIEHMKDIDIKKLKHQEFLANFDIFIVDYFLTNRTGFEIVEYLNKTACHKPVFMISETNFPEQNILGSVRNVRGCINKWGGVNSIFDSVMDNAMRHEVLNLNFLRRNFKGDEDILASTVEQFEKVYDKYLTVMEDDIRDSKYESLGESIHQFKGVLGNIGSGKAFSILGQMEYATKDKNWEDVKAKVGHVRIEVGVYLIEIKKYLRNSANVALKSVA